MVTRMLRRWHDRERARLRHALNYPATSQWENLGLWTDDVRAYPDAASALALRVGQTAALSTGDAVLDIGPGMGDEQRVLWQHAFGIGRYCGQDRDSPTPPPARWQHVLAVDSAYLVPQFAQRIETLWPQVQPGGSITWTDVYLARRPHSLRLCTRLRVTSALTGIDPAHWRTRQQWQDHIHRLPGATATVEDLTDAVLDGFVRYVDRRRAHDGGRAGLGMAVATAALLRPLLAAEAIGYALFCVRRGGHGG